MTSFVLLTLFNCHAGNFSSFSHCLSTAAFPSANFHRLWHRYELVHQIVLAYRIEPFLRDVIFMISWWSRFQPFSRGFMRLHDARMLVFWMLLEPSVSASVSSSLLGRFPSWLLPPRFSRQSIRLALGKHFYMILSLLPAM